MGPAVVLGQDLAEAAGPVRDGAAADLAAGNRKLGDGHRETAGISRPQPRQNGGSGVQSMRRLDYLM
jgi:hypothetical protein